jgi:DNA-binding transcriptional LysR family regulator
VRYGNFAKAAQAINITQSGLSRSIKTLEELLGMTVLIRNARGVEPTAFGVALIPHAKAILNERDRALHELLTLKQKQLGSLRLGMTPNFAHHFVGEVIHEFLTAKPDVDVVVRQESFPILMEKLQVVELDVVIALQGALPIEHDLVVEPLFVSKSTVYVRSDHPLALMDHVGVHELAAHPWAMLDGAGFQGAFLAFFRDHGLPMPRQMVLTNSMSSLKRSVLLSPLLTVLPTPFAQAEVASGLLKALKVPAPAGIVDAVLIYRQTKERNAALRTLIDIIRKMAAAESKASAP